MISKELISAYKTLKPKELMPALGHDNLPVFIFKDSESFIKNLPENVDIETYIGDFYLTIEKERLLFIYVLFVVDKRHVFKTGFLPNDIDSKVILDFFLNSTKFTIITNISKEKINFINSKKNITSIPQYNETILLKKPSLVAKEKIFKWFNSISHEEFLKIVKRLENGIISNSLDLSKR